MYLNVAESPHSILNIFLEVNNAEQIATEQLKHDLEEAIQQWQNEKVRDFPL